MQKYSDHINMEGAFPTTHTTTTTTTTPVVTDVRFDPAYVRTLPGTLKCGQMVLNLCGFICISVTNQSSSHTANWFSFVSFGGLLITLILFLMFIFHLVEKLYHLPWLLIELVYCIIWTFFNFTAATAAASVGFYGAAFATAAFFGYLTMVFYGFDSYLKWISYKAGEIAQGDRAIKASTPTSNNQ